MSKSLPCLASPRPIEPRLYYRNNSPTATGLTRVLLRSLSTVTAARHCHAFSTNGGTCSAKARWRMVDSATKWRGGHERGSGMMESYGILGWIVIGLLAGGVAKLLMPGRDPGGCIVTILLGIAGALLAGFLGRAVGWYDGNESAGFLAAIVGAFIILFIYRRVITRRR